MVPVPVLVGVAVRDVISRAHANKHVLDGPLELCELSVRKCNVNSSNLAQMDADERETNALNVNIMAFVPVCALFMLRINRADQSFPIDPQLPCLRAIPLSGWSRLYLERGHTEV